MILTGFNRLVNNKNNPKQNKNRRSVMNLWKNNYTKDLNLYDHILILELLCAKTAIFHLIICQRKYTVIRQIPTKINITQVSTVIYNLSQKFENVQSKIHLPQIPLLGSYLWQWLV